MTAAALVVAAAVVAASAHPAPSLRTGSPLRARVRHNFWMVSNPSLLATPCGLDRTAAAGTVLRTAATCTRDTT